MRGMDRVTAIAEQYEDGELTNFQFLNQVVEALVDLQTTEQFNELARALRSRTAAQEGERPHD